MLREHIRIRIAELVQKPRRTLHVREQEGDGAGGKLGHGLRIARSRALANPPGPVRGRPSLVLELGAAQVVLDREQERVVLRELAERSLRLVVEIIVPGELRQEAADLAVTGQRGHAKKDL